MKDTEVMRYSEWETDHLFASGNNKNCWGKNQA